MMPPPPRASIAILSPLEGEDVPVDQPLKISMKATGKAVRVWLNNDPPVQATKVPGTGNSYTAELTPTTTGPATLTAHAMSYVSGSPGKRQTINLHILTPMSAQHEALLLALGVGMADWGAGTRKEHEALLIL